MKNSSNFGWKVTRVIDCQLPYWYILWRVLKFAILPRQYPVRFYFVGFNGQIRNKVLNFAIEAFLT